jgi:hypothetical protein
MISWDNLKVWSAQAARGVGLPYKEGDYFGNILIPNDTFLILVKIQPIKGTILGLVT